MLTIKIPKMWDTGNTERLILRIRDLTTNKSVSKRIRFEIPTDISNNDTPSGSLNNSVLWVDSVENGTPTAITERIRPSQLINIKRIANTFYKESKPFEDNSTDDISDIMKTIHASRWVTTPHSNDEILKLTRNSINKISTIDLNPNHKFCRIIKKLCSSPNSDDGSAILDQLFCLYLAGLMNHGSLESSDARVILGYKSFPSVSILSEMHSFHSTQKNAKPSVRSSSSIDRLRTLRVRQDFLKGIYTFGSSGTANIAQPALEVIDQLGSRLFGVPTIIYSANPSFLMAYAPRLAFYMSVLTNQRFHIHLVAEPREARKAVETFRRLLLETFAIRGINIDDIECEFSWSKVPPNIPQRISYYASARYLIAEQVMLRHDQPVWIQDVDLFPTADPRPFTKQLDSNDINVFKSTFLHGRIPWIQYLAGNVYVKNSQYGREFLQNVASYLQEHLTNNFSWMIDQNALAYAVEISTENLKIGDMRKLNVPLTQSNLSSLVESKP